MNTATRITSRRSCAFMACVASLITVASCSSTQSPESDSSITDPNTGNSDAGSDTGSDADAGGSDGNPDDGTGQPVTVERIFMFVKKRNSPLRAPTTNLQEVPVAWGDFIDVGVAAEYSDGSVKDVTSESDVFFESSDVVRPASDSFYGTGYSENWFVCETMGSERARAFYKQFHTNNLRVNCQPCSETSTCLIEVPDGGQGLVYKVLLIDAVTKAAIPGATVNWHTPRRCGHKCYIWANVGWSGTCTYQLEGIEFPVASCAAARCVDDSVRSTTNCGGANLVAAQNLCWDVCTGGEIDSSVIALDGSVTNYRSVALMRGVSASAPNYAPKAWGTIESTPLVPPNAEPVGDYLFSVGEFMPIHIIELDPL